MAKKIGMLASATAALVLVGAVATAVGSYDILRVWPTIEEHQKVAGRSCENQRNILDAERRGVVRDLSQAQNEKNVNWATTLQEQLRDIDKRIAIVNIECGFS